VLVWNMTLDQTKASGDPVLSREVEVEVGGLTAGATYRLTHHRVDADHSNIASLWGRLRRDGQDWPDDDQWSALRAADRLDELEPARDVVASTAGVVQVAFELPMPGASFVELTPR
jgi:xylan 1,4-beta-xylosidase